MVAVIGGETHRFAPLVDLYREAGRRAGHAPERLTVGLHSMGYVAETSEQAVDIFFPSFSKAMSEGVAKERGWPPMTSARFDAQNGPLGAYVVGSPEEVAEKILRHSEALGGISRFTFMMDAANLSHEQLMRSIELIGTKVSPLVNK
jgi:alkanesulfonate monooxygenase SsuD/methylene tetrahydromethanopterin reductase-like flavin-dependent oxidoreductase (luciferase family)